MAKKKKFISNKPEKLLLSDVLPYEVPIIFSNRQFYHFVVDNEILIEDNVIRWSGEEPYLKEIIKILFGLADSSLIEAEDNKQIVIDKKAISLIPFHYKIKHRQKAFRSLNLVHPRSQISVVDFYRKNKDLITYYCNQSEFSLRIPVKEARYYYTRDRTFFNNIAHDHEHHLPENFEKEYLNLKSFYSYKSVSNIHKFYESYRYQRCEKKYDFLYKFDVSKCFDSIYTHSLSWALMNKEVVKENLGKSNQTFGGEFDYLMRNLNYGETNGIIIGPEFSRIFAEIIFQRIDFEALNIFEKRFPELRHRRDYEVFRYVDDLFLFYSDEFVQEEFLKIYQIVLKKYNLYVNHEKSEFLVKPLITNISRAKIKIVEVLDEIIRIDFKSSIEEEEEEYEKEKFTLYVSSNKLITKYKSILIESGVEYRDVINFTLGCLERKFINFLSKYNKLELKKDHEKKVFLFIVRMVEFAFFLYTVDPKVNTTLKLCLVLSKITKFVKTCNYISYDYSHQIYKLIHEEIYRILKKNRFDQDTQIETLYLLVELKSLGREYRLEENYLGNHFNVDIKKKLCNVDLNYFAIITLLFYIGDTKRYNSIRLAVKKYILAKYSSIDCISLSKSSELTLLFFDIMSCPYLDRKFKNQILDKYNVIKTDGGRTRSGIINFSDIWFTKWRNFDFVRELEAKRSQDVY